jgi:hypothetical protein
LLASGGDDDDEETVRHSPHESVPRLETAALQDVFVPGAAFVLDFDGTPDRLVLLDPMSAQVFVVTRAESGTTMSFSFGRRGAGPG